ncbi:MAG: hypothetical protein K2Z81_01450 [Cyanobacteria bacterium]|nr:hypothetical protein [Cyanobacteriota bacterium]
MDIYNIETGEGGLPSRSPEELLMSAQEQPADKFVPLTRTSSKSLTIE